MKRRTFIKGIAGALAAPAILKGDKSSVMDKEKAVSANGCESTQNWIDLQTPFRGGRHLEENLINYEALEETRK